MGAPFRGVVRSAIRLRFLMVASSIAAGCAQRPALERHEYTQVHMGVETRIVIWAAPAQAASAARAVFVRIAILDSLLSDYRADSELSRVNAAAGGPPVVASEPLLAVLTVAIDVARASDGAFDPTVGPLTRVWRAARRAGSSPDPAVLREAAGLVRWTDVRIDRQAGTVQLARPGMALDLGGIAKGRAVDEALAVLLAHGVRRALVQMGGDLGVTGPPPDETGWRILLATPADTLRLAHGALAISGPTEQFIEVDGTRYSHVLDPRTGTGLTTRDVAIVLAPTAMLADALATAAGVLSAEGRAGLTRAFPEARIHMERS